MPVTYVQRSDTSDLSGGGEYSRQLVVGTATVSDLLIALAASQTKTGHSFTAAGVPGTAGLTGNYTVEVDIAIGDSNVMISAAVGRVNSAGTIQTESSFTAEQAAAGAVLTFNLTSVNLGTWAAGDRLRVAVRYRNAHTHTARDVTVSFNTVESEVIAPWAGATDHTAEKTDPLGLLDSAAPVASYDKTVTDALGLDDSGTGELATPFDLLGLVDSVTAELALGVSLTDPLGMLDSLSHTLVGDVAVTDPLGLTDSIVVDTTEGHTRQVDDVLGLDDSGTGELGVPFDQLGLTDSVSVDVSLGAIVTDPLGLTDLATVEAAYLVALTDPLGLLDNAPAGLVADRAVTDILGLTDDVTPVADYAPTLTDPLGLTDSIVVETTGALARQVDDVLGLDDSGTGELEVPADRLGLTDSVTADLVTGDITRTITDPLGLLDAGSWDLYTPLDSLGLVDNIVVVAGVNVATTDSLGLTDSATYEVTGGGVESRTVSDPLGLTDTAIYVTASIRDLTDPLGLVDEFATAAEISVTITDSLGLVDQVLSAIGFNQTVTDSVGLADNASYVLSGDEFRLVTVTDPLGLVDDVTIVIGINVIITDSLGLIDAVGESVSDGTWPVSSNNGWQTGEGTGWPVSTNPEWEVV